VAGRIEEVGGVFHSFAGNNSFGLALEVLSTDIDRAFELLEGALLRPSFRPATVALERTAQLAALQEEKDDVVAHGLRLLRQRFFGMHPLAVAHTGDEAGVAAIGPKDLAALHRRLLAASNTVLSVAGDFSRRDLAAKGRALLRKLGTGRVERPDGGIVTSARPGEGVEQQPRQQAVVFEAYPAPALRAPDFYVGEVLDEIFSGVSARLFLRVRDELGLAYFVRSARVIGLNAAMFYLHAGTAPGSEAAVFAEFDAEIDRMRAGGVLPEELVRCQTRLKAGRRMSLQTNGSKAMQAGLNALYGLPADDWRRYDAHVDAVTVEDLAIFAARYFTRENRTRLTLRP
jgi:zinc protease